MLVSSSPSPSIPSSLAHFWRPVTRQPPTPQAAQPGPSPQPPPRTRCHALSCRAASRPRRHQVNQRGRPTVKWGLPSPAQPSPRPLQPDQRPTLDGEFSFSGPPADCMHPPKGWAGRNASLGAVKADTDGYPRRRSTFGAPLWRTGTPFLARRAALERGVERSLRPREPFSRPRGLAAAAAAQPAVKKCQPFFKRNGWRR